MRPAGLEAQDHSLTLRLQITGLELVGDQVRITQWERQPAGQLGEIHSAGRSY